jgi:hypothetical protein
VSCHLRLPNTPPHCLLLSPFTPKNKKRLDAAGAQMARTHHPRICVQGSLMVAAMTIMMMMDDDDDDEDDEDDDDDDDDEDDDDDYDN